MITRNTIRRVLYVWVIGWVSLAQATPVPSFDLRKLVAGSDVIAMGRIQDLQPAGAVLMETTNRPINARLMLGYMAVDQVLKGPSAIATVRFTFLEPEAPNGFEGVGKNTYRIVFLKGTGDNYEFASPYSPSIIAVPGEPIQGAQAEDRVIAGVARVLRSPMSTNGMKTEAIHTLWGVDAAAAISGLKPGLRDVDVTVRLSAAAALTAVNDLDGFAVAQSALLKPSSDLRPTVLLNLRAGIAQGMRQPAAVDGLTLLLTSDDAETRRAACEALAQIESIGATRALAGALDDRDFEVRLNAVWGLAKRRGQPRLIPSWEGFRADESRYVNPLKAWVATNFGAP
jgi:HEAT repeats